MAKDKIAQVLEKADGKKAKVKSLAELPADTKNTKLPAAVITALNEKFPKANLSKVMVHTGPDAEKACKELGSRAFAQGSDIFFGKSSDAKDNQLLAHEISHVVQTGGGKIPSAKKGKVYTSK